MPAHAQIIEKRSSSSSVDSPRPTLKRARYAVVVIFGVATLLYILQLFTPPRLTTDGITYLSFADAAVRGNGLTSIRETFFVFPKGYPVFLFALMRVGGFSSATLVASNLVFLGLALLFSFRTLTTLDLEREVAAMACLFT